MVKFVSNEVVYYIISVINFEVFRFDIIDGSRVDDDDLFFEGKVEEFMSVFFRNIFGNDIDGFDLREREDFEGRSVDGLGRCEVDNDVNVRVFFDGFIDGSVDGKESFFGILVEFLNVVVIEGVNYSGDGRNFLIIREVKVEYVLDGMGLEIEDERFSVFVERLELRLSVRDGFSVEFDDLVVGLFLVVVSFDSINVVGYVGNVRGSIVRGSDGGRGDRSNVMGDGGRRLFNIESYGDDGSDRRFGVVDFYEDIKRFIVEMYSFEIFLIVRISMLYLDFDVVLNEIFFVFFKGLDDIFESGSNVGEVGSIIIDDEDFIFGVRSVLGYKVDDGFSVFVGLIFGRGIRVFIVVGEFMGEISSGNGVGVDNGGIIIGNYGLDLIFRIKDSEFERSIGRGVEFLDVSFFFG